MSNNHHDSKHSRSRCRGVRIPFETMIKEAYVSFEVAKLLKEKGFDESIHTWYNMDDGIPTFIEGYIKISNVDFVANDEDSYSAPTHQMACAWLREVHDLYVEVVRGYDHFFVSINKMHPLREYSMKNDTFDDYDKAIESALKYTLENLI